MLKHLAKIENQPEKSGNLLLLFIPAMPNLAAGAAFDTFKVVPKMSKLTFIYKQQTKV